MENRFDFFPLVVVSVLALLVPLLLHRVPRLRVPIIVGEILAGIAVGPTGFGLIRAEPDPWLEFLRLFGFAYLMFLSGLEIDFGIVLRGRGGQHDGPLSRLVGGPLRAAWFAFALTLAASLLFAQWIVSIDLASNALVMALVLSTTSLGIVAPVLKERELTRGRFGQYVLVSSAVADFATVTLVSLYVILHTQGLTFELLFVLLLLAATFLAYRLARLSQRHLPMERLFEELSHATAQLDTRGALALAVVFIALAQGLGVEMILGAFMAGAIVSLLSAEEGSMLRPKLNALGYGFFIPIFFIMVGVQLDLGSLLEHPRGLLAVPAFLVMAFAVKYLAGLVYRPLFGWRETLAIGTLMSARLSLIIAVAAIGVEIGALTATTNAAIVLVAIVSVLIAPTAFNRLMPESHEPPRSLVIVAGSTPHARLLAKRLQDHGEDVVLLTGNRHLHEEMRGAGLEVVLVEPGRLAEGLEQAGAGNARALVTMLDDEQESLRLALAAKNDHGIGTIVAHVKELQAAGGFHREGFRAIDPSLSVLVVLEGFVRHAHAFSLLTELDVSRHAVEVRLENRQLVGHSLGRVRLPGDALVLMIVRDDEVIIPRGDTRLRAHDRMTVVGSPDATRAAIDYLGG